jgi:hypothetical protein
LRVSVRASSLHDRADEHVTECAVAAGRDVSQNTRDENGMVGEMATLRAEWISCCSYNELCANSAPVINAHMLKQTLCIFALPPNYSTPPPSWTGTSIPQRQHQHPRTRTVNVTQSHPRQPPPRTSRAMREITARTHARYNRMQEQLGRLSASLGLGTVLMLHACHRSATANIASCSCGCRRRASWMH